VELAERETMHLACAYVSPCEDRKRWNGFPDKL